MYEMVERCLDDDICRLDSVERTERLRNVKRRTCACLILDRKANLQRIALERISREGRHRTEPSEV